MAHFRFPQEKEMWEDGGDDDDDDDDDKSLTATFSPPPSVCLRLQKGNLETVQEVINCY